MVDLAFYLDNGKLHIDFQNGTQKKLFSKNIANSKLLLKFTNSINPSCIDLLISTLVDYNKKLIITNKEEQCYYNTDTKEIITLPYEVRIPFLIHARDFDKKLQEIEEQVDIDLVQDYMKMAKVLYPDLRLNSFNYIDYKYRAYLNILNLNELKIELNNKLENNDFTKVTEIIREMKETKLTLENFVVEQLIK